MLEFEEETYIGKMPSGSGGDAVWGGITGTLSDQTDLQTALNDKANKSDISSVYIPKGSVAFSGLPTPASTNLGYVYNINESFTTDNRFIEGASKTYPAGTNVVIIEASSNTYMFDVLSGFIDLSGKQDKLTAGTGIDITNNVISVDSETATEVTLATVATTGAYSDLSGIPTVNNATLTINQGGSLVGTFTANASSDVTLNLAAGSDVDDSTITENAQNKIQAVGVVNQNTASGATTPLKLWEGTEQEWNTGGAEKTWYNYQRVSSGTWSNKTNLPYSTQWKTPEFGNGTFILMSNNDKAAYSTNDGTSWVGVTLPNSENWGDPLFANNIFVSMSYGANKCIYSTDNGKTWTEVTLPATGNWRKPAYGNGVFVTIDNATGKILYSLDNCATWTLRSTSLNSNVSSWTNVVFEDGVFVVLVYNGNRAYYSEDNAVTWHESTLPITGYWLNPVVGDGSIVALINQGKALVYSKDKGKTWNTHSFSTSNNIIFRGIGFANHTFVVLGYNSTTKAFYSTDGGDNWIETALPVAKPYGNPVFANGIFVAVDVSNSTATTIYSPNNGKNWYSLTNFSSNGSLSDVVFGTNNFITIEYYTNNVGGFYSLAVQTSNEYTEDYPAETTSTVYTTPNVESTLTVSSVGTDSITLSDTNTYYYNVSGNVTSYSSVGETYPNLLCNIEGVGVKKGSALIADATGSTSSFQTTANLVTSLSNASTDVQYPSAKCVYDLIGDVETLISAL